MTPQTKHYLEIVLFCLIILIILAQIVVDAYIVNMAKLFDDLIAKTVMNYGFIYIFGYYLAMRS